MIKARVFIVLFMTAGIVACGGGSSRTTPTAAAAAPDPTAEVVLPASAVAQMETLIREKNARTPAQRKISSQLLYAKSGRFKESMVIRHQVVDPKTGSTDESQITSLLQTDAAGRVLCDVHGDLGGGLERKIDEARGVVVASSSLHKSIRAWLPLDSLEILAAQPVVMAILPALQAKTNRADIPGGARVKFHLTREQQVARVQAYLRQYAEKRSQDRSAQLHRATNAAILTTSAAGATGSVISEGSRAHGADRARKFYNVDGTGVRIGVLSDSDDLKEEAIATGDLPADTVTVPGQDGRPGSGEGTAMMEVVHDLAPGAKLFFATAFNSPESFAENIQSLRFTYHCDIIVDDVSYFFESPYQDDIIAQAVNEVTTDGGLYFSSAGNGGNFDDGTAGVWEGDFKARGTLATLPSGYTVHDFGSQVISNRVEVSGGPLILHWSDPGSLDNPQASNDYDLFVLDEDLRNVLIASTDVQDGTGLPFEFLGFNIPAGLRVVVAKHASAQTRALRVELVAGELGLSTPGAIYGHSAAASAVSVAAVNVAEAAGSEFVAGPLTPVEIYSSDGRRRVFYNPDGTPINGKVTFAGGGGVTRSKPDLSAADGVSTTLPGASGLNPFFGTSAAAPHAAAIAGLIKSALPALTSVAIRQALVSGSLDIEAQGNDRDSGAGIASAFNGLKKAGAVPAVFLELGTVTIQPSSGNFILPGSSGQLSAQLVNNGGANASTVSGTLSTSSPGVNITRATVTYPNVGAGGGTATNTQPYLFTVDPATSCGAKFTFQESVSFKGRGTNPTLLAFSAQSGAPSATATTFQYGGAPVAIPDDDSTGVVIPLTVSGFGSLSKLSFKIDGATCVATTGATTVGLDHSWVGDLTLKLTSPAGTQITLMDRPGGALNSGNNFCQTTLADGANSSIQNILPSDAPYSGTFSPANPLSAFIGENATGDWLLTVTDSSFLDTGSVRSFSIDANGFTCTP